MTISQERCQTIKISALVYRCIYIYIYISTIHIKYFPPIICEILLTNHNLSVNHFYGDVSLFPGATYLGQKPTALLFNVEQQQVFALDK